MTGCSSVPMETEENNNYAKEFNPPREGMSGIYIYREGIFGAALKKDLFINDECLGETAIDMFFYKEVKGDKDYKISTESEFGQNDLILQTKIGRNYFVEQYIVPGLFVGGSDLKLVDKVTGQNTVLKLDLGKKGTCGD